MKITRLLLATLTLSSTVSAQPAPSAPPEPLVAPAPSEADRAWEAVLAAWKAPAGKPPGEMTPAEHRAYYEGIDARGRAYEQAVLAFAEKFPNDNRSLEGLVQLAYTPPLFITGFAPDFDQKPSWAGLRYDETARAGFKRQQAERLARVLASPLATERQIGGAIGALFTDARIQAVQQPSPENRAAVLALIADVATRFPQLPFQAQLADGYLALLREQAPAEVAAYENQLRASPIAALRELPDKEKLRAQKLAAIGAIAFTAADGREVDVAKLKGKVVLIDFWATWCGPCIAELPNVRAVYEKYHDKGFEIVGITLENPRHQPKDTPEQKAEKLAAAKRKMLDFAEKNGMSWPQYFDGEWWKNALAQKFEVESIPAMFLLDKEGNVASTEARGERLESEVKRLLGL